MGQVTTTQTFADGDLLTALKLSNILGNSSIDKTSITDQTAETTVASGDYFLFYDASANALRKIALSEFFARPLAIGGTTAAAVTSTTITATTIVSKYVPKAWANVTTSGLSVSGTGVSTATKSSTGNYVVNFSPVMSNATYTVTLTAFGSSNTISTVTAKSTSSVSIRFSNSSGVEIDPTEFSVLVFNNT